MQLGLFNCSDFKKSNALKEKIKIDNSKRDGPYKGPSFFVQSINKRYFVRAFIFGKMVLNSVTEYFLKERRKYHETFIQDSVENSNDYSNHWYYFLWDTLD